jgi:F-type H+-transporting ATPase subunit gamma
MANLKEIRTRIASVKNTRQVTSAMKMVSAAKLRKAQDAILQLRPYTDQLHKLAGEIAGAVENDVQSPLTDIRKPERVLLVLYTSNKGLCGAFNYQIAKEAITFAQKEFPHLVKAGKLEFLTIGKKGSELIRREGLKIWRNHDELLDEKSFQASSSIAKSLIEAFIQKEFDQVNLFYNGFKNAAVQRISNDQFLPVAFEKSEEEPVGDYIFEPSAEEIIKDLLPTILQISFHGALLDSLASEHGARMTAMHKATDNATDLVKELTLNYNKARQAAITNEITEIVSGANALGK